MAAESAAGAHGVVQVLQPAIMLLGLGILSALASKALRLSPIVGYILVGAAIAAAGFASAFRGPIVSALAEAGVMFLLFNLGMHFSLSRIREEAGNIFGFGALQMLVAGGGFSGLAVLAGLPLPAALITGFALGLSSTAVVIGIIRERDQEDCPVGRAAQSILIFQDIAAIALLVVAGALGAGAGGGAALAPALAMAAVKAVVAFMAALLFARYLTEPLFRLISRAALGEVYTATALFLALAAGWATGLAGLSLTLGAFLGGVALAESRYRVLVQTEIEAFRGLFLGFFFMTVGLSLDIPLLARSWPLVIAAALLLTALKCALNIIAGRLNRWSVPGSVQLGFLLGQGSEFALVIFAIPAVAALLGAQTVGVLVAAIALSLALTPAVSNLGRNLAGKLRRGPADRKLPGDDAPVIIVGLAETGRALADALTEVGIDYLALEPDRDRFETAVADGYQVHYATSGDPRSWDVLSLTRRRAIALTTPRVERVLELSPLVQERLPGLARFVALDGAEHHDMIRENGALPVDVSGETGHGALIAAVLDALGANDDKEDLDAQAA